MKLTCLVLILLVLQTALLAQLELKADIQPFSDDTLETLGSAMSISGDYMALGVIRGMTEGTRTGVVYIFKNEFGSWTEQARLAPEDVVHNKYFGRSVALDGEYLLVGADGDRDLNYSSGAAYVFHRDGEEWRQQAKLLPSDGHFGGWFGMQVDLDGELALIGAPDYAVDAGNGAAYIFRRIGDTWVQEERLTRSRYSERDLFGFAVSLDFPYAAIGAFGADSSPGINDGALHIFRHENGNWFEEFEYSPGVFDSAGLFGFSVSISNEKAVVGAPGIGLPEIAYSFRRVEGQWERGADLPGPEQDSTLFGFPVKIEGNTAIAGSRNEGGALGAAYLYEYVNDVWTVKQRISAPNPTYPESFGAAMAYDGHTALIGATAANNRRGAVYIYDDTPTAIDLAPNTAVVKFALYPGYPNPFNPRTTIPFSIDEATDIRMDVFDLQGRLVRRLFEGLKAAGRHEVEWDGRDDLQRPVSSGVYIYRLSDSKRSLSGKVALIR